MKQEIEKYLTGVNANNAICEWVQKRVFILEQINQGEVEHIIDYLITSEINLEKATYEQMKKNAKKWLAAQIKKGNHIKESKDDTEVVLDFKDGFKFVKLVGKNAFQREGFLMSHCVAGYYGKNDEIYSLRDKDNMPHATLSKASQQIKGKGNGSIHPKYIFYVVQFLEKVGISVRDNEMLNLGYINIEKFKDELGKGTINGLFKEKYHYKENKLIDKEGKEFASLELWDLLPLVTETKIGIKINYELKSFIKFSLEFLWSKIGKVKSKLINDENSAQIGSSGDYAKIGSSGDYAQIGSSGYYAQIGSSGNYAKIGSSGDSAKIGSSGDSAQIGSSGDYAQIGSSGYYAKIGSSGYYAKIGSSGDSAQIGSSGYYAKIGSSGYYAQIGSSGNYAKIGSSGDYAQIEVEGENGVCAGIGYKNSIKAKLGTWITLAEYDENTYKPICVKSAQIDGKKLKENTLYMLKNKMFVEVK